jgi:Transcription factor WhiB
VVAENGGRQAWLDRAACRDQDPERFFPDSGKQVRAAEAKAICASYQVRRRLLGPRCQGRRRHRPRPRHLRRHPARRAQPATGNRFPEPNAYRQDRELAEQAHALASQVGLRQAARQLGIHRSALKAAFQQWGFPPLERRVGWQPSRFLTDHAQAERAFQLAERLGSVNAAAAELGTTWPSLRKAFARHGLGMPACNPAAVRQRAVEAARQRTGRPASLSLDPGFVTLNHGELPVRARSGGEVAERMCAPRTTRPWAPGWWWSCTEGHAAKPSTRACAITRRAQRAHRRQQDREQRDERRQTGRTGRTDRPDQPHRPQERGMVADTR